MCKMDKGINGDVEMYSVQFSLNPTSTLTQLMPPRK